MRCWIGPVVLALSMALGGCRIVPPSMSATERASIEAEVRSRVDAFATAERRLDAEAAVAFLAPDFRMYVDGVATDYETVVRQIRATLPSLERFETTWSDVEVVVLTPDHALVSLTFRDDVTFPDGKTTRVWGPTTFLWSRIYGVFRIRYADSDHYPVSE